MLGCTAFESNPINVDGEKLQRNADGSVSLTKEQVEYLKGKPNIVILDSVLPAGGIAVTEKDLQLLSKDRQLMEETVNGKIIKNDVYTFLIKQGSLKENLNRLSSKYSTEHDPLFLEYGDVDYYVAESKIIRASSVDELVGETLASFPVFAEVSGVTFYLKKGSLKDNLIRLSDKYSTSEEPLSVEYAGGDLHVPKSELLKAESLEKLIADILAPYPVFSAID